LWEKIVGKGIIIRRDALKIGVVFPYARETMWSSDPRKEAEKVVERLRRREEGHS
jgi:hypothetical protein